MHRRGGNQGRESSPPGGDGIRPLFHPPFITVSHSTGTLRANRMPVATIHPLLRLAWLALVWGLLAAVHIGLS